LAEEFGAEVVRNGAAPKRRARRVVNEAAWPIMATGAELTATAVGPANILTVECPSCGARSRVEAPVAELLERVAAVERLLLSLRP
jgi:hypothetical protein